MSEEALRRIEQAEESLGRLGLAGDVRVRDQGQDLARIEVRSERFDDVMARRQDIVAAMHDAGFLYVTLDLEGFRSGSHNLVISLKRPGTAAVSRDPYRPVARRNSSRRPDSSS